MANGAVVSKKLYLAFKVAEINISHEEVSTLVSKLHDAHFDNGVRSFKDPFNVFDWTEQDCAIFVKDWKELTNNEFKENYLIERQV